LLQLSAEEKCRRDQELREWEQTSPQVLTPGELEKEGLTALLTGLELGDDFDWPDESVNIPCGTLPQLQTEAPAQPMGAEAHGIAAVESYLQESMASSQTLHKIQAIEFLGRLLAQQRHPPLRLAVLYGTRNDLRSVLRQFC
jgi:hypothetical protein